MRNNQDVTPAKNLQGERDFAAVVEPRQQRSSPILDRFKTWLNDELGSNRIRPKSPVRAALTYTLNQWEALRHYTEQGYLSMDNNTSERLCKIAAIGRKNYLFVGNERAGQAAELHHSIQSWGPVTSDELDKFLPDIWLRSNPSHRWKVGTVRLKDRESADRRKRQKRLNRLKRR